MDEKPKLIAFSQYKIGGVQSYYANLLANDSANLFHKRWIFYRDDKDPGARLPQPFQVCEELVFDVRQPGMRTPYDIARELQKLISKKPGVALCNFAHELIALHLYRRPSKTIFFICHDKDYLIAARRFEFLIDVFIAHNPFFYDEMVRLFPHRTKDIYYLPYGIKISGSTRQPNLAAPLRIVSLCRLDKEKGVWDIPEIEMRLEEENIRVEWTIIGDGPEKQPLTEALSGKSNFRFFSPASSGEVDEIIKQNDIFILPSRLDGLPVAMLETMSVGCVPLVSEFNPGIRKIVTPDVGFVVNVGDVAAFARTIKHLHYNRTELEELSARSKTKVRAEYDVQKRADDYYQLFSNFRALKKKRRRRLRKYAGWLDFQFIPRGIAKSLRQINRLLHG